MTLKELQGDVKELQGDVDELKMVSSDTLLMKIPEVSREEWEAGAKPYFREARQVAITLQTELSPIENLIEEAASKIEDQDLSGARSLLADVLGQLEQSESDENLTSWVSASSVACRVKDDAFCDQIVGQGANRLRAVGLHDAAAMMEDCPRISREFGSEVCKTFSIGLVHSINSSLGD